MPRVGQLGGGRGCWGGGGGGGAQAAADVGDGAAGVGGGGAWQGFVGADGVGWRCERGRCGQALRFAAPKGHPGEGPTVAGADSDSEGVRVAVLTQPCCALAAASKSA